MTTTTDTCWADPLSRRERAELARMLSRHCAAFFKAGAPRLIRVRAGAKGAAALWLGDALTATYREMADLYRDVTERAEVPQR